ERRALRLLFASQAAHLAGDVERALTLIEEAANLTRNSLTRADAERLRGNVEMWRGPAPQALRLLQEEAHLVTAADPMRAAVMLTDAVMASIMVADGNGAKQAAEQAYMVAQQCDDIGVQQQARAAEALVRSFMGATSEAYQTMRDALSVAGHPSAAPYLPA